MNQVELQIIIDELDEIARSLYDESIDKVNASFKVDAVIDELRACLPFLEKGI